MYSIGRLPLQPSPMPITHPIHWKSATRYSVLSPNHGIRYTRSIFYSAPSCICFGTLPLVRRISCLRAQKKHRNKGETVSEGEDSVELSLDADEDVDDYDDMIDEEEEEDDDGGGEIDDIVLDPEEMEAWLSNEPRGFGAGKVYDTSVEDKLLEEIERSHKAQLSNVSELKSRAADPNKDKAEKEGTKVVASGIRVRISQLPRKKNIQRDLNAAFKGIPGIVNITPVVSGNKKTRDPVCKGLAFVDFKSPEDANRFIRVFSSQTVGFGKVIKQIKCELLSSSPTESSHGINTEGYNQDANVSEVNPVSDLEEVHLNDGSEDSAVLADEQMKRLLEDLRKFEQQGSDKKLKVKSSLAQGGHSAPKEGSRTSKANKPPAVKKKSHKVPASKLTSSKIPKPAKRLQAKEKSMFVDVLSRYGSNVASAADSR